jgi:hypothetical protein
MKSYPTLVVVLLSLFYVKYTMAEKSRIISNNRKQQDCPARRPPIFASAQSPRVYQSAKQFDDIISWPHHIDSLKACY